MLLDFPTTYTNAQVHCQSEYPCLHKTVTMVVFFLKMLKIPTQRGEHSCKCTELSLKQKKRDFWGWLNLPMSYISRH